MVQRPTVDARDDGYHPQPWEVVPTWIGCGEERARFVLDAYRRLLTLSSPRVDGEVVLRGGVRSFCHKPRAET